MMHYEEILNGLSDVPISGSPGKMVINGEHSQAVFAVDNPANVFLAASQLGTGRVFVCSHDCYYKWFVEKIGGLEGAFINNVRSWLAKNEDVNDSSIVEAVKLKDDDDLSSYKIILWHGGKSISHKVLENIKEFTFNGGGLFCAMTLWGYLSCNKNKSFQDVPMFNFLHDNLGIILTDDYFGAPTRVSVSKNKAKYSNFRDAIEKVCCSTQEIPNYCDTIDFCINGMARCGITDLNSVEKMKEALLKQCEEKGWSPTPSKKNPVKVQDIKQVAKLLCNCYIQLGEKAPNIDEFPFDFDEPPALMTNVALKLHSKFSERLSTGYYLPAGVEISITVTSGDIKGWKCRIGAHCDILKPQSDYRRWPVCYVIKQLKEELNFKSSFGGIVYFDWYLERIYEFILFYWNLFKPCKWRIGCCHIECCRDTIF